MLFSSTLTSTSFFHSLSPFNLLTTFAVFGFSPLRYSSFSPRTLSVALLAFPSPFRTPSQCYFSLPYTTILCLLLPSHSSLPLLLPFSSYSTPLPLFSTPCPTALFFSIPSSSSLHTLQANIPPPTSHVPLFLPPAIPFTPTHCPPSTSSTSLRISSDPCCTPPHTPQHFPPEPPPLHLTAKL